MMTSAQSCLITSFFKSPPNCKESCQVSTEKPNLDEATRFAHGDPIQSDRGLAEDCDSDSSNDGSSSGSDEEESERKPLVVNLCGLLSPEVMNGTSGRRKMVGLAQKRSANHRIGSNHHGEEEVQPKGRTATGGASNLNAGQESSIRSKDKVCSMELSQESSNAIVDKTTCVPSDAHLTSTATKSSSQMKQCIFSWNSKSGKLDLSVPIEPPKASNTEELGSSQEDAVSRREREEERVEMAEEGAGEDDIAAELEGSAVLSTSKQRRRRKRKSSGSDGREDGECLQGEPRVLLCLLKQKATDEVLPEDVVAGSEEGGLGVDDSFEDFVESIKQKRGRQKRKHSRCKTTEEPEEEDVDDPRTVPSQQPTKCSSTDSTSDGEPKPGKRPRRSAAVSASARISSRRRSRRSSVGEKRSSTSTSTVDLQQTSAEPGPRNVTQHSCVTLNSDVNHDLESVFQDRDVNLTPVCVTLDSDHENEPQELGLEDKECEADNSVIFVSSTPPTTSTIKHSSPLKPSEPIASATAASVGLSAAWAKIFSRPNKSQSSEAVSTAKEKTVGSPVRGVKKRRTPSNSPRRHGSRSPSRSPRKGHSPRRGSPLRVRSPRKSSLLHSSPLREARCPHPASRQLAFSGSGGGSRMVDSAPFEGVVHVQQIDPSCELWKLDAPKSLPVVRSLCRETIHPEVRMPDAGGLGLFATQASAGCSDSKIPSHIQLCSEEENDRILKQLEEAHPQKDVRGIYARYTRIATPPSAGADSQTGPERKPSSKPKKEKKMNTRRTHLSLKCSIRIRHGTRGTKDSKITVDTATYQKRDRRSLRLAKKTQESISEDVTDLGNSTQAGKIDSDTRPNEPCPAASTNAVTKPPAFVLDPWTKVYRPRGSSEVIGNGAQVEKLRVWLGAWKTRCCSQREGEQKAPMAAGNKERSDRTGSCEGSEKGDPRVRESGVRHDSAVPWWVSEKDSDFLSISHLRRKRYRAPKCLDSSESGGETSEEEDDDSLCPVTLLCGPHGSGKSAAVYVCAQELGFKVFEVNSSGTRSRQTIMSTLREVTLSHQVVMATQSKPAQVTGRIANFFGRSKSDPSKETKVCKGSNLPSNSGGLYSFFKPKNEPKKQGDSKPTSTSSQGDTSQMMRSDGASSRAELETKKTKKRRKSQAKSVIAVEDVSSPAPAEHTQSSNSVTLATATVILLDEVDILFDEDKGFWSAVYELIATTKRPIIMTCNDPRYDLDCDHQKLLFSRPPIPELSLHMQLLCLSHGAHMTSEAANQIAAFLNCDIRKVMNCLQFWLSLLPADVTVGRQQLESASNVGEVVSRGQSTQICAGSPDSGGKEDLLLSLEHLLGFSASERQLLKRMQQLRSHSIDPSLMCGVLETLHRNGLEVAHPLDWLQSTQAQEHAVACTCTSSHPTSTVGSPSASADMDTCSDLSRIRSSPSQARSTAEDSDTGSTQEIETERSPTDEQFFSAPWRCRRNLKIALKNQYIDALSNFSDTLSHMDTVAMASCDSHMTQIPAAWWKCELETGLLDELPLSGRGDCWRAEVTRTSEGMVGVAEGLALGAWQRRMRRTRSCGELYDLASRAKNRRRAEAVHSSLIKCSNTFAPHWELSHVAMATDGLPVLQLICHSENLREAAHVKRRFRHHLQASAVDLCDLKALPRTAAFLSTSHPAEPP